MKAMDRLRELNPELDALSRKFLDSNCCDEDEGQGRQKPKGTKRDKKA